MIDEIVYSELAKSFAAHGQFLVRDVPSHGYGFVYPVLIAPAWRLFGAVPEAYAAAKAINARRDVARRDPGLLPRASACSAPPLALVAAVLTVLVPSMLYTGTLMTENAFYPLFLVVALALVATLERPTPLRQVVLLVLCGLAYATRAQAVALVAAAATAPLLLALFERRGLRARAAAVRDALRDPRRRRACSPCSGPSRAGARRSSCSAPTARRPTSDYTRRRRPPLRRSTTWPSSTSTSACSRSRRCSRSGSRRAARRPPPRAFAAGVARARRLARCSRSRRSPRSRR